MHVLALDQITLAVGAGVGVAALIMIFFAVKFWLVTTRPVATHDVATPALDRLNAQALEHMAGETAEEDEAEREALENEDAPSDLKAALPPDETTGR